MSKIRVSACSTDRVDLVGDVDPVVIGGERGAGVELQHQPGARPAGGSTSDQVCVSRL